MLKYLMNQNIICIINFILFGTFIYVLDTGVEVVEHLLEQKKCKQKQSQKAIK